MIEVYDKIYKQYKEYILKNSKYAPNIVKTHSESPASFPTISFVWTNWVNESMTNCKTEYYDQMYFTINVYTKNISTTEGKIAKEVINNELVNLTIKFIEGKNMLRTSCKPTPNFDTEIYRNTIQFQCQIGNARNDIIRR